MKKSIIILAVIITILTIVSCEDPPPKDYIPRNFVDAILIVDQPISDVIVMKTQAVADSFDYAKALIRDAEITIKGDGRTFGLIIDPEGEKGYYDPDGTYLIKPETEYELEININGEILRGKTKTPPRTEWIERTPDPLQYPKDTNNLPALYDVSWKPVKNYFFYFLSVVPLDTLNYGTYLEPPTEEPNRRIYKFWADDQFYYEKSSWALIANTKSSVVWGIFKWYGMHEVNVYVADKNYTKWFIQHVGRPYYDELLGSVENGIGVFGSASVIRDTFMLLKNQP